MQLDEYSVGVDGPWSDQEAAHLWRRAGFGALPTERLNAVGAGNQAALRNAVDVLVNFQAKDPHLDRAAGSTPGALGDPLADLPNDTSDLGLVKHPNDELPLQGHWLYRMRYTSQPLQEQLALFLHDHLTTSADKVYSVIPFGLAVGNDGSNPDQECSTGSLAPDDYRMLRTTIQLVLDQNYLYRETGADSFRTLLLAATRDPAMLIYLDNYANIKDGPQENYAREVMELFSMGVGNYNEQDIRQIARCLTGESFPFADCEHDYSLKSGFITDFHEPGAKTVFGHNVTESFTGQETVNVIDLILAKVSVRPDVSSLPAPYNTLPAAAIYLSWKLISWFVSHDIPLNPPHAAVLELADYMRGTDNAPYPSRRFPYDFRAALRKLFLSRFFYDPAYRFAMYKTPADFVTSALRLLGIGELFTDYGGPADAMGAMGMRLFLPPNVAGWNHGKSWITSGALIARYNYAYRIAHQIPGSDDYGKAYLDGLLQSNGGPLTSPDDNEGIIDYFGARLVQRALNAQELDLMRGFLLNTPASGFEKYYLKVRGIVHLMLTMPAFQLK